jgi:transcriptional regulator with XRE-family HTH domain
MPQIRNKELLNKIVLRIKELRDRKGVSQKDVYLSTDVNIGRLESEKVNITVSTLHILCEYFEITLSEFFKDIK